MTPERGEELKVRCVQFLVLNKKSHCHRQVTLGKLELKVGQHYWLGEHYVRLIKVTNKGFNFLDEGTSRCALYPHLYATGFHGKPLPVGQDVFWFWVPATLRLCAVKQSVC
jgi:hypothetical protein